MPKRGAPAAGGLAIMQIHLASGRGLTITCLEELHRSLVFNLGGWQARGSESPGWAVSPTSGRFWGAQLCTRSSRPQLDNMAPRRCLTPVF